MNKRAVAIGAAALMPLTLICGSGAAQAAEPRASATMRVSKDCLITITARWSGYPNVTEVRIRVDDETTSKGYEGFRSTTASRGTAAGTYQAEVSTTPHSLAGSMILISGGQTVWVSDKKSPRPVYCAINEVTGGTF